MTDELPDVTFVFTDIEGSTRLWELQPERMRPALAAHDALARHAVETHGGRLVKSTGDGIHAAFEQPLGALQAALQIQHALADPSATAGVALSVRCGLHLGADERRDGDFFGRAVNRAARIMSAAHGGQTLLSQAVAERLVSLPAGVSLKDLGRVRLRDLSTPERVYQVMHPSLRADFPPLRSLEATPNNLAQQLNSFVGREREMTEVKALLAEHRLVMLLGLGGIGKSRLSVQLGAEVVADHPDGVWLVELAPLNDPQLVPQALASVLGVKEEAGRPVIDALLKFVRDRRLLVILDNCEHVVHACADLAKQLLQAGPMVKMLASSREVLRVAGETVYHLPTLSAPEPGSQVSPQTLAQHDAVRLFVERATAAQPAFALSERNVAAVADICHRLDGIPLALELAAARTRAMPVETLAARLSDRFRLLKTSDQTVLPRQRTLRALIDWSYDLLDASERAVFQRLSVFAGGWTLEAAEAVCAGGDVDVLDVLDLLGQLVEKSLVVMDAEGARYRMLETVRQYAQERLSETGDAAAACARHLDYFVTFAEKARPELAGSSQGKWLARLDLERENFLSSHLLSKHAESGDELGLRQMHALRPYWINRGELTIGLRLAEDILERNGLQAPGDSRCMALFGAGQMSYLMGHYRQAEAYLSDCLSIARANGNAAVVARVLQPLGMTSLAQRDFVDAHHYLEEALVLADEQGNQRELASALNALAMLHRMQSQLEIAKSTCERAIELARALGDKETVGIGLLNLAMVLIECGAFARVVPMLNEVTDLVELTGSQPVCQSAMEVCAGLSAAMELWTDTAGFFGAAEAQRELAGLRREPADEAFLVPFVTAARTALSEASFFEHESLGRQLKRQDILSWIRRWLDAQVLSR